MVAPDFIILPQIRNAGVFFFCGGRLWFFLQKKKKHHFKMVSFLWTSEEISFTVNSGKGCHFFLRQNFTVLQQIFNLPRACWGNVNFCPWPISQVLVKIQREGGEEAQVLHVEFGRTTLAALQCSRGNADTEKFIKNKLVGPAWCWDSELLWRLKALLSVCHVKKKNNKLMWKMAWWKYLLLFQPGRS